MATWPHGRGEGAHAAARGSPHCRTSAAQAAAAAAALSRAPTPPRHPSCSRDPACPPPEASRTHGIPQVAVGAWEGLHGLGAPVGHADGAAGPPAPPAAAAALGHPFATATGGLLSSHLPAAASLLQHAHPQPPLRGRDVPQVLDQVAAAHHFAPPLARDGADGRACAAAAAGSGLMPPRCVPDAASGGVLGPRALGKQQGGRQAAAPQHRRGGRGHSSGSVSLNKQIMAANSTGELLALVRAHGGGFDFFNISTAIARVPKLVGPHACGGQVHGVPRCGSTCF
jgi:hypothetical protein